MSRAAVFFLVVLTLGLSVLLALLGMMALDSNFLGWFLLLSGSVYFFGVLVVYWIRRIQFWQPRAPGETLHEEPEDRSFWLISGAMMAAFYLPPLEYLFLPPILGRGMWVQWAGATLVCFGSFLFIWARRALGRYYSGHVSVLRGQQLVQHGPYRIIRHPAYAGYLLIAIGLAIGFSSLAGVLGTLVILLPSIVYRISVEDRLLAACFGGPFDEYARSTCRLLPGIW